MKLRSVLTSAPAVAGFALLALVIGTIVGVRAGMNDGGDTEVAGTVIERPEPIVTDAPTEREIVEPLIVRPRPERTRDAEPAEAAPVPVVEDLASEEEVSGPVGLVRDPAPVDQAQPTRPRRQREPAPEPEPEPRPRPRPEPTTQPEPEDTSRFALRTGDGLSRDTAEAVQAGNSGNWDWQIRTIGSHHTQDAKGQRSRAASARLEVGFNEEVKTSKEQVRDFRCDALLTAGSRRLVTDADHVFEISFWTTDGYTLLEKVDSVLIRKVVDLQPGQQENLYSNVYEDLDAADGVSYTCKVTYRER